MRLLFAHDHRFYRGPAGELYSVGSFPAAVWERYLRHFDAITMLARDAGELLPTARLASSDHPRVEVRFAPDLGTARQLIWRSRSAWEQIERAVADADAVAARLPSEIGLAAVQAARKLGKPYAVEVVGCPWDGYSHHGSAAARLYAPLAYWRMKRAVGDAPLALYVTSNWLQARYPSSGYSVNASNVEIEPLDRQGRIDRDARLAALAAGRPPRLGTVASLTMKTKGVQTALAALAMLRRDGLELSYSVLGPGDQAPWRALAEREGIADLVSFDGTREAGEGVRRWLDGIDIHLQPSFQEGLPRATIEAMSRGVACIGSTCGGIPELLAPERTHRPGDVGGLAACIRRLAESPALIAATSRADLDKAQDYEQDVLRERRDEVYARLRAWAERQSR